MYNYIYVCILVWTDMYITYIYIHTSTSDFVRLRSLYQVMAFRCLAYSGYMHQVLDAWNIAVPANVCHIRDKSHM